MGGFGDYFLDQEYQKIVGLGNKLGEIRDIIDWEKFRPILSDMYRDNKEIGGRPHHDEILMIKMLIPARWHGLSDYEVEFLATDRYHSGIFWAIRTKSMIGRRYGHSRRN